MITPLDPVVAQIIPLLPLRDPTTMTPQSARDALRALAASRAAVPPPPVTSAEDIKVKGAAGFLSARAYRNSSDKSPTVVFFHGGGWVAGDLDTHDRQARWLAIETGAVVVSVDYRRPPEVRFPGAFEDAFAATKDIIARIAEFGGDDARVGVAGDSAGGNLAATTAIACRDAGIKACGATAGLSRHRRRRKFRGCQRERALSLAQRERGRLFPHPRHHGMVLRPLPRRQGPRHRLARVAAARQKPCRACARDRRDRLVRSTPRRGQGLRRRTKGSRRSDQLLRRPGLIHGYFGLGEASETAKREAQRARADFKRWLEKGA